MKNGTCLWVAVLFVTGGCFGDNAIVPSDAPQTTTANDPAESAPPAAQSLDDKPRDHAAGGSRSAMAPPKPAAFPTPKPNSQVGRPTSMSSGVRGGAGVSRSSARPNASPWKLSTTAPPETPEAFRTRFLELYAVSPKQPWVEMTWWEGADSDQIQKYMDHLELIVVRDEVPGQIEAGNVTVTPLEGSSRDFYPPNGDQSMALFPEPTHLLHVSVAYPGDDNASIVLMQDFAVGMQDGKLYFCRED